MRIEDMQDPANLQEAKKAWESLFENPAWVSLCEAIQAQADALQHDILFAPVTEQNTAYMQERKKGQLEGRLSLTATAEAIYQDLGIDLQRAVTDKENENVVD